jgi:hypothetical protein
MRVILFLAIGLGCSDLDPIDPLTGRIETDSAVDFGDVQIGIVESRDITVRNTGSIELSITGARGGEDFSSAAHEFSVTPTSFSLAPGTDRALTVSFQAFEPMAEAARSSFVIETDAGETVRATVDVSGRGIVSGLVVDPNPIDFGTVLIGSSASVPVTITNTLDAEVEVTGTEVVADDGNGAFSIDGTFGALAPGASLSLEATYAPDPIPTSIEDRAHFDVSNCSSALCAVRVDMRARPSQAALECTPAIEFGAVPPDATAVRTIACTNVASDPVEVLDWALDPNSASSLGVEPFAPVTVPAGGEITIDVSFAPTAAELGASVAGTLVIRGRNAVTTDGITPVHIALSGSVGGPAIRVLPQALDFGDVQIGTIDRAHLLVVNDGVDPLLVSMVASSAIEFDLDLSTFELAAGGSTSIDVSFAPFALGLVEGALTILSNDGAAPMLEVPTRGNGVDLGPCAHSIVPADLNWGVVTLGSPVVREVEIRNAGAGTCLVKDLEVNGIGFALVGAANEIMIGPGDAATVGVSFDPPRAGDHSGDLSFYVSDPAASLPSVPLFGVGLGITAIECPAEIETDAGTPVVLSVNATSQTGTVAAYGWQIVGAPIGAIGTPNQWNPAPPDAPTETFLPYLVGRYEIEASVTDGLGITETCTTAVTAFGHGFRVELTWDGFGDVDLHVHNSTISPWFGQGGPNGNADDCFYANCSQSAVISGPIWDPAYAPYEGRNPSLDVDNIVAFGPENIRVDEVLPADEFTVALHYFWDHGFGQRVGTVNIFCGRTASPTASYVSNPMDGPDQGARTDNTFWKVATVTFTSTNTCGITTLDMYETGNDAVTAF